MIKWQRNRGIYYGYQKGVIVARIGHDEGGWYLECEPPADRPYWERIYWYRTLAEAKADTEVKLDDIGEIVRQLIFDVATSE